MQKALLTCCLPVKAQLSMLCRLSAYAADERLLERPFYHQFAETDWHLDFATNTNIAGTTQEAQKRYVRTLHDRKLVSELSMQFLHYSGCCCGMQHCCIDMTCSCHAAARLASIRHKKL